MLLRDILRASPEELDSLLFEQVCKSLAAKFELSIEQVKGALPPEARGAGSPGFMFLSRDQAEEAARRWDANCSNLLPRKKSP